MKTAVSIPDRVFRSAEQFAKRLGMSRSELYARALSEWMERRRDADITARLNEICSRQPMTLDPAIRASQRRTLPKEDW